MSVRRSLAWSYGGQAVIFVQTFAVSVLVARILGPYEMGIYAVGAATAGLISIMSAFSVGSYLIRHPEPSPTLRATAFTVNAVLSLIVAAVILTVALLGPRLGMIPPVSRVLMFLAATPVIGMFEFLPSTLMQRDMSFKQISLIAMGRAVVNSAVLLVLAWTGWGYLSLAIATLVSAVFTATAANVVARAHASVRIGLEGWREMTRFGLQMMSIGGLAGLIQRMSELILGHFLGLAALGLYSRASSFASQLWDNVYGLGTRVIFAQMAKEQRETDGVRRTYTHGLALLTGLLIPLFAGVAVLARPIVQTLYGERWLAAAAPLSVLMVALVAALAFSMNWELCVLRHRTGWQARNEAIRAVVGLVAFTIGATMSVAAAAAGRLVEIVSGLVLYGPHLRSLAGTARGEISAIYRQAAALTLGAVAPAIVVMTAFAWAPRTPWKWIVPAIAAGVFIWFALLRHFEHPLLDEMKRIARRVGTVSGLIQAR